MLSVKKIGMARAAFQHIKRLRKIVGIIIKYGFGDILKILKIDRYLYSGLRLGSRKKNKSLSALPRPARIRMALEELGPAFIKLGQMLSTRPDIFPLEYLSEIEKLQDDVPSFPFEEVKKIILEETGRETGEIFESFNETPLAAASIGQAHRAKLKSGEEVVVKVQRPGIKKVIETDLEILYQLASLAERNLEEFELHRPTKIIDEFAKSLKKEINFLNEASNIRQFAEQYKNERHLKVPHVYMEYTNRRILTMEYIDGIKANNIEKLKNDGCDLKTVALNGANLIMEQVFTHGFFHADPHPGNIFILPGGRICFIDFGMIGRISRKEREVFAELVMNISKKDEKKTVESVLKLTYINDNTDIEELERDISEFIGAYMYIPLKEIVLGNLLFDLIDILTRNNLCLKPHYYMMMKALSSVDGLARALYPDFDIIGTAEPFVKKTMMERLMPAQVGEDLLDYGKELAKFLKDSPEDLRSIFKQIKDGKLRLEYYHKGLDEMLYIHNRISNKLSFAIILAAAIIASSLIILSGVPPKWHDIPILGLAAFTISGLLALILLISFIRRKKF